jgi:hypothetical protein
MPVYSAPNPHARLRTPIESSLACFVLAQCATLQRCRRCARSGPVSFVLTYRLWARAADLNVALDWAMVGIFVCAGQATLSPTALHARLRSTERAARAVRSAAGRSLRKPSPRLACDVPCASRALKVCSATSRLLVHEKIYDVFIERLLAHAKAIKLGDPFDESVGRGRSAAHCSAHPALQTRPRHVARNGALRQRAVRCGQRVALRLAPRSSEAPRWGRWSRHRSKKRCWRAFCPAHSPCAYRHTMCAVAPWAGVRPSQQRYAGRSLCNDERIVMEWRTLNTTRTDPEYYTHCE